jgi:hypothetical protein
MEKTITITVPAVRSVMIRGIEFHYDRSALSPETRESIEAYGFQRMMNDNAGRHVGRKDGYMKGGKFQEAAYAATVKEAAAKVWTALLEGDTASLGVADRSMSAALRATALDFFAQKGRKSKEDRIAIRKDPRVFFDAWAAPIAVANGKDPATAVPHAWGKMIEAPATALFETWKSAADLAADNAAMFD